MATGNFWVDKRRVVTLEYLYQGLEKPDASEFRANSLIWDIQNKAWYTNPSGSWVAATFSGAEYALGDLTNVTTSGATDGQALVYDVGTSKWGPATVASSGSATALNELSDVTIVGPADGNAILYDASTSTWRVNDLSAYSKKLITDRAASTSQSVSNSDSDKLINATGTIQFTLPDTGIDDGFQCTIMNTGSGTISFAGASGSTLTPSGVTLDNTASGTDLTMATVYHDTGGAWYVLAGVEAVSSSDISDFTTAVRDVVEEVEFNAQTGTSYTFVLSDAGKVVSFDNASAITVTVPPNSSVAYGLGTTIGLVQENSGTVTVAAGAGVTLRSKNSNTSINGQWATAALLYLGSDVWLLSGDLA